MSDQSQGPGWWLASDGKWYPPQPTAPSGPPTGASDSYSPTQQMPTTSSTPAGSQPWGAGDQGAPTQMQPPVPSGPPPGGGYQAGPSGPPGGPPPGQYQSAPPAGGGGKTGLLIGIVVLVVLLVGAGIAFALTRPKTADVVATPTTSATSTTVKPDSSTTTEGDTTTTKKKSTTTTEDATTTTKKIPSTSRLTTTTVDTPTTEAPTSTIGIPEGDPTLTATLRKIYYDQAIAKGLTPDQANCIADGFLKEFSFQELAGINDNGGELTPAQLARAEAVAKACT